MFIKLITMSLIEYYTEIFDPAVARCVCGGEAEHGVENGCGYSGYAFVKCSVCGLKMIEESGSIGWNDVTLKTLYVRVVARWNDTMVCTVRPRG